LRQLLDPSDVQGREKTPFSLYPGGFLVGSLVEIVGSGKTEFLTGFLKEHKDFQVAWIEENMSVNPYALFQKGVELKNVLFVETKKEFSWSLSQILQSGCFQAVVTSHKKFIDKDLRRFQLLSERGRCHLFLLSSELHKSWVPNLQLEVMKEEKSLNILTHKKRGYG
jgi:hypothetical protein